MNDLAAKKPINITILRRREITTYPKLNEPAKQIQVTYIGAGLPPHFIAIPKEEYDLKLEKKLIKKDIEERLKDKPESYQI